MLKIILLAGSLMACTPMRIPTLDQTRTVAPSSTLSTSAAPRHPTIVYTDTPSPKTTILPLPIDSELTVAAIRLPTSTAVLFTPTPVQTLIAHDHNPSAILVEADILGGLSPVPREAHVPLYRLYADGFVVFAGDQTPLSTGLDATVLTGYLIETEIQQLLAFLRDSGFYGLEAYYQPKPAPADLPTAHITVNLNAAKTVQVYAPGFVNTPAAFYDAFAYILRRVPETSKLFAPNEGHLVAVPAGSVSDFRSRDMLTEWAPSVGTRLAEAVNGNKVSGSEYQNVVSLVARTFPNTLYREGDLVYRVAFSPQLPRAVDMTDWVETILQAPREFEGRTFDIVGYYRGSNLLGEARGSPPVNKANWVVADKSGAIYVTGVRPPELDLESKADIWSVVRVRGVVVYVRLGTSYLEARRVEVLARGLPDAATMPTPTNTFIVPATPAVDATATRTRSALPSGTPTSSTTAPSAPTPFATLASSAR